LTLLVVRHLRRTYQAGDTGIDAVADISLDVAAGEFVAVVGPSGCGKSTLLHLCGGMDRPSAGRIELEGADLAALDDEALTRLRRTRVGFVFQSFNLLPTLTLAENIALPLLLDGCSEGRAIEAARALGGRVGLQERLAHYPSQLSGGEQQRGAVARALVHRPALVVADEPTGNLDTDTGRHVLRLLQDLNRDLGVTLLLATHAPDVARLANRVVVMRDGRIEGIDERRDGTEDDGAL
jgi:putative ABC transport system ATP-binding protein